MALKTRLETLVFMSNLRTTEKEFNKKKKKNSPHNCGALVFTHSWHLYKSELLSSTALHWAFRSELKTLLRNTNVAQNKINVAMDTQMKTQYCETLKATYNTFCEAPSCNSSFTIDECPFLTASCSGESFSYPGVFKRAPIETSSSTTARWPRLHASCWNKVVKLKSYTASFRSDNMPQILQCNKAFFKTDTK